MRETSLECGHCEQGVAWREFVQHVKICIAARIQTWNEREYSVKYYKQVRAISRFKSPGDPRRRNKFRSWGWWTVPPSEAPWAGPHNDGPALLGAEVPEP